MSDAPGSRPAPQPPLTVVPVAPVRRRSGIGAFLRLVLLLAFAVSVGLNFALLFLLGLVSERGDAALREHYHSGAKTASDKIAIVEVDGLIAEGMIDFARRQIDQAASDDHVKAVVLRINSPGGSVTASDDLYRRLCKLRDGDPAKKTQPKPIVASMASLAASGGYYIAMAGRPVVAERTTITGSIGVFAAFPNVSELGNKYGFHMDVIRAGEMKDSGSMFKPMTPQERQLWQDMVDHAFGGFLAVVEEGRPALRGKLREVVIDRMVPVRPANESMEANGTAAKTSASGEVARYVRRRADGGIFTADVALKFGLVDQMGYLSEAILEAKKAAGLGDNYRAVSYEKPQTLLSSLIGIQTQAAGPQLDAGRLAALAAPRLWYLSPQSEGSVLLSAFGSSR
jgi:protease-4